MKPLVSCICITQNRRFFLRQAIEYFMRAQHHCQLECELVIVDGSQEMNLECVELVMGYDDIRYFHAPRSPHTKTGWFHNEATERARGDIIIRWDDDDWQASNRIQKQVNLLGNPGTILAFTSQYVGYHLAERKAFRSRCWNDKGQGSMGASFAYHRALWEKVPFRDVDQGEDAGFFEDIQKAGFPMVDMQDPNYFLYIRHNQNGSPHHNDLWDEEATSLVRKALLPEEDLDFYDELSEILPLAQWNHPTTFGQHGIYNKKIYPPIRVDKPGYNITLEQNDKLPQPNVHLGNRPTKLR